MQINDEMVEKAAAGYWNKVCSDGTAKWPDDVFHETRDIFREGCRAALEAALSDAEPVEKDENPMRFFADNVDNWGALEWFNRMVDACEDHDRKRTQAFRCADEDEKDMLSLSADTSKMIVSSSAFHLAREHRDEIRNALAPQPAPSVAVKALEWKSHNEGFGHGRTYYGTGVFGHWYGVSRVKTGCWECVHHIDGKAVHLPMAGSLESAKAAAQADYEARIRSAVSAQVQDVAGDEDWQTVPKHPTGRMIDAVVSMVDDVAPHPFILNLYRAMLAAAPAKQEG